MLVRRVLKRALILGVLAWGAFAWATGRIDPAAGTAKVYSVVSEKLGRNKAKGSGDVILPQDAAAARALAAAKAAGLEQGKMAALEARGAGAYKANDVLCLAHAIYYEAGKDAREAQVAVAQVAINRTSAIPGVKTICRIIYLGLGRPMGCMFASTCRNLGTIPDDEARWKAAIEVAQDVASGKGLLQGFDQATHFHTQMRPRWVNSVYQLGKIGRFTFYSTQPVEPLIGADASSAASGGTSTLPQKRAAAAAVEENTALAARRRAANLPRTVSLPRQPTGAASGGSGSSGPASPGKPEGSGRSEAKETRPPRAASPTRSPFGDAFN